jgi:AraC family transcriptional regulator
MTVGPEVQGSETITIKDFPGGLYAVQRVSGVPMPDKWMRLAMWLETSRYRMGEHPWLEECLTPEAFVVAEGAGLDLDRLMFDLYLPVA